MKYNRRNFIVAGTSAMTSLAALPLIPRFQSTLPGARPALVTGQSVAEAEIYSPTFSITPVLGDGKWIWRNPPSKSRGHLEPRLFDLRVDIAIEGQGAAQSVMASTAVPVELPEQKIIGHRIDTEGCTAEIQRLSPTANQLVLARDNLHPGEVIGASAKMRLEISKSYFGYQREQFPANQKLPAQFPKALLGDSPGIQTRIKSIHDLVKRIVDDTMHPWDKAQKFQTWGFENIKAQIGEYTSVKKALSSRTGDCEERAGVFIALCRACGIPARLVWVPNHSWAEFLLVDELDQPHWIPCHTAAYTWFGWTGAHELVLQKGDSIEVPLRRKRVRLVADWYRSVGKKPRFQYTAELTPVAQSNADPGPGARKKMPSGKWVLVGQHPDNRYMRD